MILYGDKREEYRERKDYWTKRLDYLFEKKLYSHVKFTNGYGNKKPCFVIELKSISIGHGKQKWGYEYKQIGCFILKLGDILATN